MWVIAEVARQQGLLDVARDVDFLLEALAFAFASYQASVVQNAGGLIGKGVEQLAIQSGKRRGATGIQIQHAEKLPLLEIDHGFRGLGVRKRVQGNYNNSAQTLRDDALRGLQIHFGLRQVFGDYRFLLSQGQLYRSLAGGQALWRQAQTAGAPGEPDV